MLKLYSSEDPLLINHLKNILEANEIPCILKNIYLSSAAGRLPPIECWPELWLVNDDQYENAMNLVNKILMPTSAQSKPWICSHCGEKHEQQFTACWRCGANRSD